MDRQHRIRDGRQVEISPMRTSVKGTDNGLPAGAAERGERPRSTKAGITELVVDKPCQCGPIADIYQLVQLSVQLVDALSGLDMDEVRLLLLPGLDHVLDIVAVETFGYDIGERLSHRLMEVPRVVGFDEGVVADGCLREGPVTSGRLEALVGRTAPAELDQFFERFGIDDPGGVRNKVEPWIVMLAGPGAELTLFDGHKLLLPIV